MTTHEIHVEGTLRDGVLIWGRCISTTTVALDGAIDDRDGSAVTLTEEQIHEAAGLIRAVGKDSLLNQ